MNKHLRRQQKAERGKVLEQVSALPYRALEDGSVQIPLITTRETRPIGHIYKCHNDAIVMLYAIIMAN